MNEFVHDGQLSDAAHLRVARHVAACLNLQAKHLPQHIAERLRMARARAMQHAHMSSLATVAAAAQPAHRPGLGTAGAGTRASWWWPVASLVPLILLVSGLAFIQQYHESAQIHAAAEVDAALLSDNLPPAAYQDPGFIEFLKYSEP